MSKRPAPESGPDAATKARKLEETSDVAAAAAAASSDAGFASSASSSSAAADADAVSGAAMENTREEPFFELPLSSIVKLIKRVRVFPSYDAEPLGLRFSLFGFAACAWPSLLLQPSRERAQRICLVFCFARDTLKPPAPLPPFFISQITDPTENPRQRKRRQGRQTGIRQGRRHLYPVPHVRLDRLLQAAPPFHHKRQGRDGRSPGARIRRLHRPP